jgi:hypothetical protein
MKKISNLLAVLTAIFLGSCENEIDPIKIKQLDYYIDSYEVSGLGFKPQMKVQYEYNDSDRLTQYTVFSFNPNSQTLEEQRHFEFSYENEVLTGLKGFLPNAANAYIEYTYQYLTDGRVSKINENNLSAGLTSEANFSYNDLNHSVKVAYTYSNGSGFEYEFNYQGENIIADKTTKGSQLCNEGIYTYDQKINPFKNLGYVDYTLTTLSTNNKLTESVNYIGCSFPTLIPESYSYAYDNAGYPVSSTTTYSTDTFKQQREYFYK